MSQKFLQIVSGIIQEAVATGGGGLPGPGIGVDDSGNTYNMDGGRAARHAHEGDFNHQLLKYMNLPFFLSTGVQQNIALNSIGNLPFFTSTGTESDVALVSPVSASLEVIQLEMFA
jgi:hypothetical protein